MIWTQAEFLQNRKHAGRTRRKLVTMSSRGKSAVTCSASAAMWNRCWRGCLAATASFAVWTLPCEHCCQWQLSKHAHPPWEPENVLGWLCATQPRWTHREQAWIPARKTRMVRSSDALAGQREKEKKNSASSSVAKNIQISCALVRCCSSPSRRAVAVRKRAKVHGAAGGQVLQRQDLERHPLLPGVCAPALLRGRVACLRVIIDCMRLPRC